MNEIKTTRRRRRRKLPDIVSPQALCDLRLQGMSFSEIASKLDITKTRAYSQFRRYQETGYDGYEPLPIKRLKRKLQKNIKLEEIADEYGVSVEGLKNYLLDHSIDRKLDMKKIKELTELGWLQVNLCSYYGVTRFTIREFIKSHNNEIKTTRRRRRRKLPDIISPQALCDLRLQGMSFSEIASKLDITKTRAYSLFRRYQETSYDGYEPIPIKKLKSKLLSNTKLEEIADEYGVSVEGLKNYLFDYSIDRKLDMEKIKELTELGWLQVDLCSYYGVTRFTIRKFIKSHNNEIETL